MGEWENGRMGEWENGRMKYDVDERTKPLLITKQEIQIHASGTLRTKSNYTISNAEG